MARRIWILAATLALGQASAPARADQVDLAPVADNTLYQSATGALSNGAGSYLFAGNNNNNEARRAVLRFDLSTIPAGSVVTSVQLRLHMSRTQAGTVTLALHRLTADWGEGTSDAAAEEGDGAPSTPGDATWIHRAFSTTLWATAGGDFVATPSAALPVAGNASYTWGSTPELVADAQAWVNGTSPNHGWILLGGQTSQQTAKRFDSRTNPTVANRPLLTVIYAPLVPTGACCAATGGCTVVSAAACTGAYQGDGTACGAGNTCGACCDALACSLRVDATCTDYRGDGTACTPDPCVVTPTGACCAGDGTCQVVTAAACTGTYQGNGTVCGAGNTCGACCDGPSCALAVDATCTAYQGDATTCSPDPCVVAPRGACCSGGTCTDNTTAGECLALGGIYQGDGQSCSTNPCGADSRACCFPNDSCVVMDRDACRNQGGDDQDDGSTCNPNICGRGACCLGTTCVADERGQDCLDQGGIYRGPGSVCSPDPCSTPTCDASRIAAIRRLLAVKAGLGLDVAMSWLADGYANAYNTWYVTQKTDVPLAYKGSAAATGVPGCLDATPPACSHSGGVSPSLGTLLFYNVRGSCNGAEATR